jgi:hypothetical protein
MDVEAAGNQTRVLESPLDHNRFPDRSASGIHGRATVHGQPRALL